MVRFLKRGHSLDRLLPGRGMFDGAARHAHSLIIDGGGGGASPEPESTILFRSEGSRPPTSRPLDGQFVGSALDRAEPRSRLGGDGGGVAPSRDRQPSGT